MRRDVNWQSLIVIVPTLTVRDGPSVRKQLTLALGQFAQRLGRIIAGSLALGQSLSERD